MGIEQVAMEMQGTVDPRKYRHLMGKYKEILEVRKTNRSAKGNQERMVSEKLVWERFLWKRWESLMKPQNLEH